MSQPAITTVALTRQPCPASGEQDTRIGWAADVRYWWAHIEVARSAVLTGWAAKIST